MVQVIQVFRPKSPTVIVDKSKPFSYTNMIPCDHDSPALIPKQAAILSGAEIAFLITRSKNDNTVVYKYVIATDSLKRVSFLEQRRVTESFLIMILSTFIGWGSPEKIPKKLTRVN
jgi:hypothetical protein